MKKLLYGILKRFLLPIVDLLFKYIPLCIYSRISPRKQCWLITERPTDARDNGWALFKWLRDKHPEIRVVYAIHRDAQDFAKLNGMGEVIEYGSWKHWLIFMTCSVTCSTSWGLGIPTPLCYLMMRNLFPPISKRVFLQHGITKDYMPQGRKKKLHADIFVCGAKPEWEYINANFGYQNGEVQYLGFCRFDFLVNNSKKQQILYMPTWRNYIDDVIDFESTDYYKTIASFLQSTELNVFLATTETELVFFIHPHFKNKKVYFTKFCNSHIEVMNNDDYDLQKLICSANMLVTDFSSIYFDFAYQGKPVVYYHFDYEDYRNRHYAIGYFNYDQDGFGPICKSELELISTMKSIADNAWLLPVEYQHRADRFFPIRDTNNCQRHFDALCRLDKTI